MTYRLYGDIGSGSAIVEMALAEIGAEVELHDVPLHDNAQKARKYAAVNPQCKLPSLVLEEGETLTESAAILL
ncbi:MAG: glutathione S-transferase N-terminal domain-containing protein, partial [Gammaproteobacteria bacterium]|nr:glutathione S-transferase N-terminal domain-containing protein [Gammaproteobacteria bacterium]